MTSVAPMTETIAAPQKKIQTPSTTIEVIGPKEARYLLRLNTHNRPVRQTHLSTMIRDMNAGRWDMNGESIKISDTDVLLDGQHRLVAVVESKTTWPFVVVRGLPEKSQETVDIGAKRKLGDALHLGGEENANNLGASIRVSWYLEHYGRKTFGINPSQLELREWLEANPEIRESVKVGQRAGKGSIHYTPSAGAALHYRMSLFDADLADAFWNDLIEGTAKKGDPVFVLREALIRDLSQAHRMSVWHRIALTIKAWNATRDGKTSVHAIGWRSSGKAAEPFPVVR